MKSDNVVYLRSCAHPCICGSEKTGLACCMQHSDKGQSFKEIMFRYLIKLCTSTYPYLFLHTNRDQDGDRDRDRDREVEICLFRLYP